MKKIVHDLGLDVHEEAITVSIAPENSTEVRRYGIIGGTLDPADNSRQAPQPTRRGAALCLRGRPCGFVLCRHLRGQGIHCDLVSPSLIRRRLPIG